jgi:outer membrane protein TolC
MPRARPARFLGISLAALLLTATAAVGAQGDPTGVQSGLTFAEAQRLAAAGPTVQLAERALELARRQLALTAAPLRGELSAGYRWTRGERDLGAGGTIDLAAAGFDPLTLTLTLATVGVGPAADAIARARAEVERAEAELRAARRAARLDVTQGFQRALRARQAQALARGELELAELELEAGRWRRLAGAANEAELARLSLGVERARAARAAADREVEAADRLLRVTLGAAGGTPLGPLPEPLDGLEGSDVAWAGRPDVLAASLQVAETDRQADGTLRDQLPSASLSFAATVGSAERSLQVGAGLDTRTFQPAVSLSYDPDSGLPGLGGDARSRSFTVAVGLRVPLNPAIGDAIAAARVGRERAAAQYELTRARAEIDVEGRRADLVTAATNAELADAGAALAEAEYELALLRFGGGHLAELALRRGALEVERARLEAARAHDATRLAALRLLDAMADDPADLE